jgi:SAM-dependent methyltransferase
MVPSLGEGRPDPLLCVGEFLNAPTEAAKGIENHLMALATFLAKQLHHPSGILGRHVLPRLFNRRNIALNDLVFENLALQSRDRVLEIGFGGGYLLGRMSAIVTDGLLAGVDRSPEMVAFCRKRFRTLAKDGRPEIKCASAEALPYPPAHFTKACTVNTLFYWQDVTKAFSELWRVLADEGVLALCFTCKESLENRSFARFGFALYEVDDVQRLMISTGFREIRIVRGADKHRNFACAVGRK